ncbi:acetate/propionate family kinase [Mycoplasma sp. Mirounga ES2805-ORL]|uniref:acetate/propionate family kinase n=1 Tax=Mycoplasma sp. Mirounga ES2805-ORL TaxID=754514 RepID=UPI00197B7D24|nr:acetate/propionate family kinase [Mycoplasma sp. Mirounga ES2805-ORL]QSF13382.1 acetate/propionate family kinase [Mycoplasma sp. Mirounga ES2805-ORL]
MNKKVLVINAGSSSIKLSLFEKDNLKLIANGLAERIGLENGLIKIKYNGNEHIKNVDMPNHKIGVKHILELMEEIKLITDINEIEIIGFRVVHGGDFFKSAIRIGEDEITKITQASIYAPLHNPGSLQAIRAFQEVMPNAKLSATFDTSFHTTIPEVNSIYPIPYEWTKKFSIKRYGAHGISHDFITQKLEEILKKESVNFVNLHIGNGASLCAVKDSKSIDTTMGLTPLAGVMMGTRSGDIDPSIHEFIANELKLNIKEITSELNKKSGLLGVSGVSNDMRDIIQAIQDGNRQAQFAFDLYAQKIIDYTALYLNKIGPNVDAIVFTAGVGENTPELRQKVCDQITYKKVVLDKNKNLGKIGEYELISTKDSEIKVYVIRTNEELLIAKNAISVWK